VSLLYLICCKLVTPNNRYIIKNAKYNHTVFIKGKRSEYPMQDLLKIDTYTGRSWRYVRTTSALLKDAVKEYDYWEEMGTRPELEIDWGGLDLE